MNQTITIDGESYEVDRTVAGAIDEITAEAETLRGILGSLAQFVGGKPCWCQCYGFRHSKACLDAQRAWKKANA